MRGSPPHIREVGLFVPLDAHDSHNWETQGFVQDSSALFPALIRPCTVEFEGFVPPSIWGLRDQICITAGPTFDCVRQVEF